MTFDRQEMQLMARRLLGALLALTLLIAFWADRPRAAASYPTSLAAETAATAADVRAPAEPQSTSIIGWFRRPWLTLYRVAGAPPLDRGRLSAAEEAQFRRAVGGLAAGFFVLGALLWWRGSRAVAHAQNS